MAKVLKFLTLNNQQKRKTIDTNIIFCADNIAVMKQLPSESIDLIYIDPPFFSGRKYETIWGDKQDTASFNDRWSGGIWHYVEWMKPRLEEIHRLLKQTGSVYIHLDWHAVHYIKIEMDKIFGGKNFRNEIIWSYQRWTSTSNAFQRTHDNILFYTKSNKYTFNKQMEPYSDKSQHKSKRFTEKKKDGTLLQIYTDDHNREKSMRDVWEISYLNSQAKERTGYPTQKPEALLERIILSSSNKNAVVADFFCGCGTTLAVAQKLNRKWIGVDCSPKASKIIRKRLNNLGEDCPEIPVQTLSKSQILSLSHFDFEEYVIRCIDGEPNKSKVKDKGIDGRLIIDGTPIQVKKSENVGRPILDNFYKHLKKNGRGIIIAISFTKDAIEEKARLKSEEGFDLKLITLDEILGINHKNPIMKKIPLKKAA